MEFYIKNYRVSFAKATAEEVWVLMGRWILDQRSRLDLLKWTGMLDLRPSDLDWTVPIRSRRESRGNRLETGLRRGGGHWQQRKARRSSWFEHFRARFAKGPVPNESIGQGELTKKNIKGRDERPTAFYSFLRMVMNCRVTVRSDEQ